MRAGIQQQAWDSITHLDHSLQRPKRVLFQLKTSTVPWAQSSRTFPTQAQDPLFENHRSEREPFCGVWTEFMGGAVNT
jgi:hypothetical protein